MTLGGMTGGPTRGQDAIAFVQTMARCRTTELATQGLCREARFGLGAGAELGAPASDGDSAKLGQHGRT
jgi:hypothetical protein